MKLKFVDLSIYILIFYNFYRKLFIFLGLILINIFKNLDLDVLRKGTFVFFVVVLVSKVFFVLGGFVRRVFLGILVFNFLYF